MSKLLAKYLAADFSPIDDFWYQDVALQGTSNSGVRVTAKTALAISTVYACVRIISSTVAMLPLIVFQRTAGGGKERAPDHPLFDVIHSRPNIRQSSFQFREMMMGHALLRGNAYAQIVPGPRGFADQLVPLHPDRMQAKLASNGTIHYEYLPINGPVQTFLQDEIFHIATLSDDGITGLSAIVLGKDSFGLTKAAENYGAKFFGEGQMPAGVLKMPGRLSQEGHDRLRTDWKERHGGVNNSQNIAIMEEGLEWQAMGLTNEDAQHLETRAFQVEEIASWFGVPMALLQHTEKSTSWGTGIAQLTHGFVIFTIQPWLTRWEQEISQDLIINKDRFFPGFVLEGLLRGDPETRSKFYAIMVRLGIMTRNEVRSLENLNQLDGGDEPVPPPPMSNRVGLAPGEPLSLTLQLATDAAGRMARREAEQVRNAATKHGGNPDDWALWVTKFYDGFRADLMTNCKLQPQAALIYANQQRDELLTIGAGAVDTWEEDRTGVLVNLMMHRRNG